MLTTILFSLLIVILLHMTYTYIQHSFALVKTKDLFTSQSDKVDELIRLLEKKEPVIDFSAMERDLADLIVDKKMDIETIPYDI